MGGCSLPAKPRRRTSSRRRMGRGIRERGRRGRWWRRNDWLLQAPKYVMNHMDRFAGLTECAAMARSGFGKRFSARNSALSRTLAANIRRLRKERGWTQEDLAAEANVGKAAISLIESGRAKPILLML